MPQMKTRSAPTPKAAKPVHQKAPFKGRPIYTDDDRKKMKPSMPPETEWVAELLSKE